MPKNTTSLTEISILSITQIISVNEAKMCVIRNDIDMLTHTLYSTLENTYFQYIKHFGKHLIQ